LSVEPLTTPEFPDHTPRARHVRFGDSYCTLYLEDATWNALCGIAREQDRSVGELCADIQNAAAADASFAQAARYYVFDHIAAQIPDCQLPSELRATRRHGYRRTIQ
jgi:predicted DNA-binding ribbon-helix-helix protein